MSNTDNSGASNNSRVNALPGNANCILFYCHVTLWSESMLWDVSLLIIYILWGLSFTIHFNILQCVWGLILITELWFKKLKIL
jgi:hypothetical protein